MYQVSDECRALLSNPDRVTDFRCEVTLANGTELTIDSSLIKNGSVYVKTKCVSGSDFELGAVCVGEFGVSLLNDSLDSRNYEGAVIRPFYSVKLSNGSFEDIPMGEFNVTEISLPDNSTTKLVCYDNMMKFDRTYVPPDEELRPASWIAYICHQCGVGISVKHCAEIALMVNAGETMGFSTSAAFNSDMKTYRDVLTMITQLLCGCAVMDRNGELKVINFDKEYSEEYPSYTMAIGSDSRKSTTIKDYKKFEAVSITLTSPTSTSDSGSVSYIYPADSTTSHILKLDDNPILRMRERSYVEGYLAGIAGQLSLLSYYGAETEIFGDPTIDVGDHILLTGGTAGTGTRILVTKNDWTYRGSHKITSDASMIQAKAAKTTSSSSGGGSSSGEGSTVVAAEQNQYIYTLQPLFISTEQKRICRISVTPDDFSVLVSVSGQLTINMILPGTVTVSYTVNGTEKRQKVEQYLSKGTHTLDILLPFNTDDIKTYAVDFFISCSHGHGESVNESKDSAKGYISLIGPFPEPEFESFSQCETRMSFDDTAYIEIPVIDADSTSIGTINWGDGTVETYTPSQSCNHFYDELGSYSVIIDCYLEKFKCDGNIRTLYLARSIKEIPSGAFAQCNLLNYVMIPAGVEVVGNYAFSGTSLTSVTVSKECSYVLNSFPDGCAVNYYPYCNELAEADKNGVYFQSSPSAVWVVLHELGKYPSVTVIDNYGEVILCEIEYTNENTVTLRFSTATAGTVYLN